MTVCNEVRLKNKPRRKLLCCPVAKGKFRCEEVDRDTFSFKGKGKRKASKKRKPLVLTTDQYWFRRMGLGGTRRRK